MTIATREYKVTLTFTEEVLGSTPKNKEVYAAYIASKKELTEEQLAEELKTIPDEEEKGWTGFHMDGDNPALMNYVIKGLFKSACYQLRSCKGSASSKLTAYKKRIDGQVFVSPRKIPFNLNDGEMDVLERPLRAQTAQGERVALARSDTCPEGSTLEFQVMILGELVTEKMLEEWLWYGRLMGIGQWRSGGFGSFLYQIERTA